MMMNDDVGDADIICDDVVMMNDDVGDADIICDDDGDDWDDDDNYDDDDDDNDGDTYVLTHLKNDFLEDWPNTNRHI